MSHYKSSKEIISKISEVEGRNPEWGIYDDYENSFATAVFAKPSKAEIDCFVGLALHGEHHCHLEFGSDGESGLNRIIIYTNIDEAPREEGIND